MLKRLLIITFIGCMLLNIIGCAVAMYGITKYETKSQEFDVSCDKVLEASKSALKELNLEFDEPVTKDNVTEIKGIYPEGRSFHIEIYNINTYKSRIDVRVGTSEAGKKDEEIIVETIKKYLNK